MKENYEYSKRQYEEKVLKPAKKKERRELAASIVVVLILVGSYLTQHVLHWW
jgi:hypothetical protein